MNEPTLTDTENVEALVRIVSGVTLGMYFNQRIARAVMDSDWLAARVAEAVEREHAIHRDLVSRLGFGDNITEPMADNDTIVAWFEQQSRDASEWQEAQLWRNDCYAMGHPQDDDCRECDPYFAVERERAAWATKIEALADWTDTRTTGLVPLDRLRAHLAADDTAK